MLKIYIVLVFWLQVLNAQYDNRMTNSHVYPEYNSNISQTAANNRLYNKNSRDSFGYTNTYEEYQSFSGRKETEIKQPHNNVIFNDEHDLTTKSPLFFTELIASNPSAVWKTPISDSYNARLFDVMSSKAQYENLVYSPISLQILLTFIFTMSDGKLYEELAQFLKINDSRTYVTKVEKILQEALNNTPPTTLIVANKLFYDKRFGSIDQSVCNFAKKSFDSEIEEINFFESNKAANIINTWISNKTHNLIKEIATSSSISDDTSALLLNSLYFKSEWLTKFATSDTEKQEFFRTKRTRVSVDMMYNEDVFRYGDFTEDLQASVVELPYKTSNLSMLLILPQDIEGLSKLEQKLRYYDLNLISNKLKREIVTVKLPRFKIEYEVDMIAPLQELGLTALFNAVGKINIFKNQQKTFKIDQLKHKSFINVNEAGTEAAATTVAKYVPLSIPNDMKYFVADHPFVFVIRDTNSIFFMGHVVQF